MPKSPLSSILETIKEVSIYREVTAMGRAYRVYREVSAVGRVCKGVQGGVGYREGV